jgi:hypothetical protein
MTGEQAELALAELWAYAGCPYEHFWRYTAGLASPPTARGLVEQAVQRALAEYYGGSGQNVILCVGQVWRGIVEQWGYGSDAWDMLVRFATTKSRVLEPFASGRVKKRDGSRYKVPQMSDEYKRRAMDAGLPQLAARLSERLAEAPVYVDDDYGIPEAFSESVEVAGGNTWPVPEVVLGVGVPFRVNLTDGMTLSGAADLVVTSKDRRVDVEVHDWGVVCPPVQVVRRDLRVVAAFHAQAEGWDEVGRVVFRHVRSGATVPVSRVPGVSRLLTALVAAASGIRHRVVVPRLAARSRECLDCAFYGLCTDGHDVLDTLDPTLLAEVGSLRGDGA